MFVRIGAERSGAPKCLLELERSSKNFVRIGAERSGAPKFLLELDRSGAELQIFSLSWSGAERSSNQTYITDLNKLM